MASSVDMNNASSMTALVQYMWLKADCTTPSFFKNMHMHECYSIQNCIVDTIEDSVTI